VQQAQRLQSVRNVAGVAVAEKDQWPSRRAGKVPAVQGSAIGSGEAHLFVGEADRRRGGDHLPVGKVDVMLFQGALRGRRGQQSRREKQDCG
jgi:hypothetical protein